MEGKGMSNREQEEIAILKKHNKDLRTSIEALKENLVEVKSYWLSAERKNKRLQAEVDRLETEQEGDQ